MVTYTPKKQPNNSIIIIVTLFGVMFGIGLILGGINLLSKQNKRENKCSLEVNATCVSVITESHTNSKGVAVLSYYPVFSYKVDGVDYQSTVTVASSKNAFAIGNEYTIYINPEDKSEIRVPSIEENDTVTSVMLIILGIAMTAGFIALTVFLIKTSNKNTNTTNE